MYSTDENHVAAYRQWTDLKENERPDFLANLEFMFRFQLGEMYFRYLIFNFAGRESDAQYSSWLKPWENLKGAVSEKSRNQYWMLPMILGLVGSGFQYHKNKKDFFAIAIFFLVTGALLAAYLNSPPNGATRTRLHLRGFIHCLLCVDRTWCTAIGNVSSRYKKVLFALPIISLAIPAWMA